MAWAYHSAAKAEAVLSVCGGPDRERKNEGHSDPEIKETARSQTTN
jgi:hypothetical protein